MNSLKLAKKVRLKTLELCFKKKASHIGSTFFVAEVLAVLYSDILKFDPNKPDLPERDRLFYEKGRACTALY